MQLSAKTSQLSSTISQIDNTTKTPVRESHEKFIWKLLLIIRRRIEFLSKRVQSVGEKTAFDELNELGHLMAKVYEASETNAYLMRNYFQYHINPKARESDFVRYCSDKPRGHTGDYVRMEMIWGAHTYSADYRYCGRTENGRLFNAFIMDTPYCLANSERVHRLKNAICSFDGRTVASIGSGSAIELDEALKIGCKPDFEVHLYDQDQGALVSAQVRLAESPVPVIFHSGNIIHTLYQKKNLCYDLIYSAGMFDYLDISSSQRLVNLLWKHVNPGGALVIINAEPNNPSRVWMELVADWFLKYKTEKEMFSLADGLENLADIQLQLDSHGVYRYLIICKEE